MKLIEYIKKDIILSIFAFFLFVLAILYPNQIINYPHFIDWQTIIALTGLLVITTGLKESMYLDILSKKALKKIKTEKFLSIFLISISMFLSTFLTNDITLFIVVPLTLGIQNIIENDISDFIIFEAISVNVGSTLTPIGNPQNLFLWHRWGISFITFIVKMSSLVIFLLVILLVFAWIIFPNKKIKISKSINDSKMSKKSLFILSITALIAYIIFLDRKLAIWILPLIFMTYLIYDKELLLKVDWALILLFILIFIDLHMLSAIPLVSETINKFNLNSSGNVFLISAFISQLISNVPASVFLSKFSHNWYEITYGVNIGGNGLIISSLANIIAIRIARKKKLWLSFHKYSIPYFLLTGGIVYIGFKI